MVYYSGYPNLASTEQEYGTIALLVAGEQPKVCFEYVFYLFIYIIYYFKLASWMKNPKILYLINQWLH